MGMAHLGPGRLCKLCLRLACVSVAIRPADHTTRTSPQNVSYGYNERQFLTLTSTNLIPARASPHPSSLLLVGPNATGSFPNITFPGTASSNSTVKPGSEPGVMNNGVILNVLFADAHVSSMKAADFNNQNYNASTTSGQSMFWNPTAQ